MGRRRRRVAGNRDFQRHSAPAVAGNRDSQLQEPWEIGISHRSSPAKPLAIAISGAPPSAESGTGGGEQRNPSLFAFRRKGEAGECEEGRKKESEGMARRGARRAGRGALLGCRKKTCQ